MWTAKLFDVVNPQNPSRRFALTMRSNQKWEASDPKGMLDRDSGNWQTAAEKAVFWADNVLVFELIDLIPDKVAVTDAGAGTIATTNELVGWRCTDVVR